MSENVPYMSCCASYESCQQSLKGSGSVDNNTTSCSDDSKRSWQILHPSPPMDSKSQPRECIQNEQGASS